MKSSKKHEIFHLLKKSLVRLVYKDQQAFYGLLIRSIL